MVSGVLDDTHFYRCDFLRVIHPRHNILVATGKGKPFYIIYIYIP